MPNEGIQETKNSGQAESKNYKAEIVIGVMVV
jgi:hypothetical protein